MPAKKWLHPFKLCQQHVQLRGQIALAGLPDVTPVLSSDHGVVTYDLACDYDDEGIARLRLCLSAELPLVCQRCLQTMNWPVECMTLLSPVRTDAAEQQLPAAYEPLQVSATGSVLLSDLLTEELWLVMPQLPTHTEQCVVQADYFATADTATETPRSPFAVLRELQLNP